MKKLLLLVALCFCASVASAQTIEIVHLKNGGRIRGIITEQIPNKQLKIQTFDGNVFVYSFEEIEKITKEMSGQETVPAYRNEMPAQRPAAYGNEMPAQRPAAYGNEMPAQRPADYGNQMPVQRSASDYRNRQNDAYASPFRPHYEGGTDLGYSIGVGSIDGTGRFNLSTSHGCLVIPNLYIGAGVGVDYYEDSVYGIPIFADLRGYFTKQGAKPFLNFRIGYSVGDVEGLFFSPALGINYKMLDVSVGYTYQKADCIFAYYDGNDYYFGGGKANIGAVTIKLGVRF